MCGAASPPRSAPVFRHRPWYKVLFNAAACFMPLMAIGSVGLVVVGFRRVLDP